MIERQALTVTQVNLYIKQVIELGFMKETDNISYT